MAKFRNGYENISVSLINFCGDDLARQCWDFGKHGEFYTNDNVPYDKDSEVVKSFINDIMTGKTFPKYVFEGHKVSFKINNISRVCLAQLTREQGFYCSASGDVRPLTQDLLIPAAIYKHDDWMERYAKINEQLEDLYVDMAKAGITFMDARYLMPHCQTISLSYCANPINFVRSCASRTQNGFADEINFLYRLMRKELLIEINSMCDENSVKLWKWLLSMSDIKQPYTRDFTYCNDFERYPLPEGFEFDEKAHNDWRNSSWKIELEKLYYSDDKHYMLQVTEMDMIEKWLQNDGELPANYDKNEPYTLWKAIEETDYYKRYKNE